MKKVLFIIIFCIFIIIIYTKVWKPFHYEAKNQLEFNHNISAGDCRFKNTAYAYDNNIGFEVHRIKYIIKPSKENNFKEEIKTIEHIYAVDNDKKIFDISNGKKILGVTYKKYMNGNNIISDELLLSGKINKNQFYFTINNYFDTLTLSSLIVLPIYFITYKLNR
ncbi:hypothetical protein ACN09M_03630 [Aliarcobacter butzleri]|uniref:hypothetical protein n=1 Tax=Aliarcobacter butzleri TaxID=28197 RepID=UPI003AE39497